MVEEGIVRKGALPPTSSSTVFSPLNKLYLLFCLGLAVIDIKYYKLCVFSRCITPKLCHVFIANSYVSDTCQKTLH